MAKNLTGGNQPVS